MTNITKNQAAALQTFYPKAPRFAASRAQRELTSRYKCSQHQPCGRAGCTACAEASTHYFKSEAFRCFKRKPDFLGIHIWSKDWENHISTIDQNFVANIVFELRTIIKRVKLPSQPWLAHLAIIPCVDGMPDYYTMNSYLLTTKLNENQRYALCEAADYAELIEGAGLNNYLDGSSAIHRSFPSTDGVLDYKYQTYANQLASVSVFDLFFSMNYAFRGLV